MALKQSKLQQIPQRNKDLAFQYVKDCEKKNKNIVPDMIKYLCLIYFNQNKDTFDAKNTHQNIKIKGNSVEKRNGAIMEEDVNSYLENIVSKGIHIWTFKCDKVYTLDMIGIRNVDDEEPRLDGYFDASSEDGTKVIGHGFVMDGSCTDQDNATKVGWKYGQTCRNNDTVAMTLNFNDLSLSFKINDNDYGKAFDIKQGSYRAVIGFCCYSDDHHYTLTSYQHIV